MTLMPCRVLTVCINRMPAVVYAFAGNPANLPQWAAGLGAQIIKEGDHWLLHSSQGQSILRCMPGNELGIMDHSITLPNGQVIDVPLRVVANGTGSLVVFVLYRQPGMTDEQFEQDAAVVENDLKTLKAILESQPDPA